MLPFDFTHGQFTFRFQQIDGEVRVSIAVEGLGELGPVTLAKDDEAELHALIEKIVNVLERAHERQQSPPVRATELAREQSATKPPTGSPMPPAPPAGRTTSKAPSRQAPARKRRPN